MDKRIKLVIVGLIGILMISLFLNLQLSGSRQTAIREKNDLKRENFALTQKIDASIQDSRRLEDKINSLNLDLNQLNKEKNDMLKKFDTVNRERQELIDRLKEVKAAPAAVIQAAPPTEDAYWAGILKAKTDLELQIENVRAALKEAQNKNEQLQREKSDLSLEASSLAREREDFKRQLEYNKKVMDGIAQDFVREKNDKFQISEMVKAIKNENEVLRRQLKVIDNNKDDMENKFIGLQQENTQLDNRLKEMEAVLRDRSEQIDSLKRQLDALQSGRPLSLPSVAEPKNKSVELPPIVVRPQEGSLLPTETTNNAIPMGKTLAVNKDNNFVVIDFGLNAGVKVGDKFQVYRGNNVIARIEVIQVREKISACDIKKELSPIKIGDSVRQ